MSEVLICDAGRDLIPVPTAHAARLAAAGKLGAPVVGTVYGVILNTRRELAARAEAFAAPPYKAPPKGPVLYIKSPNTFLEAGGEIPAPVEVEALEVNATLAVVIGRDAARVDAAQALDHVVGYTTAIDVCIPGEAVFRPPIRQRCRDGFLPIGPWVTPRQAVADPGRLDIAVEVAGVERSRWSTADLVRPVPQLIAEISEFMTLSRGDVLLVGLNPQPALARAGEAVVARIDGLAPLACKLATAAEAAA
jgi:5-oxopent-3-ene-1,2,5-tricarboxylate decarboxylase / 2-hydroxyhepta-2,4-diene-1,7-dioate isomerase